MIKRFRPSDSCVNIKLFKSYCSSFYCLNFISVDRNIMSNTMVLNGVKAFREIERELVYGFKNRLLQSDNSLHLAGLIPHKC